jgi:hypothetical protein
MKFTRTQLNCIAEGDREEIAGVGYRFTHEDCCVITCYNTTVGIIAYPIKSSSSYFVIDIRAYPQEALARLIGKKGVRLDEIQAESGALEIKLFQIDFCANFSSIKSTIYKTVTKHRQEERKKVDKVQHLRGGDAGGFSPEQLKQQAVAFVMITADTADAAKRVLAAHAFCDGTELLPSRKREISPFGVEEKPDMTDAAEEAFLEWRQPKRKCGAAEQLDLEMDQYFQRRQQHCHHQQQYQQQQQRYHLSQQKQYPATATLTRDICVTLEDYNDAPGSWGPCYFYVRPDTPNGAVIVGAQLLCATSGRTAVVRGVLGAHVITSQPHNFTRATVGGPPMEIIVRA